MTEQSEGIASSTTSKRYILGGASRSGKSIVAHKLLIDQHIPFFSTDYLMMGFEKGLPDYGIHNEQPCYLVAEKLWPVIKGMMTTLLEIKQNYLIEGDALLPALLAQLDGGRCETPTRICFMGYAHTTPQKKLEEVRSYRGGPNDWIQRHSDSYILEF